MMTFGRIRSLAIAVFLMVAALNSDAVAGKLIAAEAIGGANATVGDPTAGNTTIGLATSLDFRLNLVAALLHRPQLLLCDEPTVGIDPHSRNAIFEFLEARVREGLTVIYSTHYMEEATRLCSRIGIIDHGKIHALGTLDELLARLPFTDEISFPATPATAGLAAQLAAHGEVTAGDGTHRFRPRAGFKTSAFYSLAESHQLSPRLFVTERPTLEAVFLHLTGRTLRE